MAASDSCGAWCATAELEDGRRICVPIRCRAWECPTCGRANKRKLLRRLRYAQPTLFITLTTSERTAPTPDEAYFKANAAFGMLIKRWRRKFEAEKVEYFLVWEKTKRGWPHAHVLLAAPKVSKHWLSHTWKELTGSYVVDLQTVSKVEHAASYLAKYLAKNPQVPPGQRRYRRSGKFFRTDLEPVVEKLPVVSKWERQPRSPITQALFWLRNGLAVKEDDRGIWYATRDTDEWARQIAQGKYHQLVRAAPAHELPASDDRDFWV